MYKYTNTYIQKSDRYVSIIEQKNHIVFFEWWYIPKKEIGQIQNQQYM